MTEQTVNFHDALGRYMDALRAAGSGFPDLVRPPSDTTASLQSLRDEGKHLPGELVEWFEWFGHLDAPTVDTDLLLAPTLRCLTLDEAIWWNTWWRGEMLFNEVAPDWLSIADYLNGSSIVVNCTAEHGAGWDATVAYLEDGEITASEYWLSSLTTLLSWWTERIETGGWTYDAEGGWQNHVDPRSDVQREATGLLG